MLKQHIARAAAALLFPLSIVAQNTFERGDAAVHLAIVRNNLCCYEGAAVFDPQGHEKNVEAPWIERPQPRREEIDALNPGVEYVYTVPVRTGGVFVMGSPQSPQLVRFDVSGHVTDIDPLPQEAYPLYGVRSLEVLSDQCTVAYSVLFPLEAQIFVTPARLRTVRGYDMCNDRGVDLAMVPEATSPYDSDWPTDIRQLPNGSLLVQTESDIWWLDRTGPALKRWPIRGVKLALTPDGDGFWIELPRSCWECVGHLLRFDLAAPPEPVVEITLPGAIHELNVNGEFRAALQPLKRRSVRR